MECTDDGAASGVRSSDIKNISLRRNKIGPLGGVALALMIRDYPEGSILTSALSSNTNVSPSPSLLSLDSAAQTPYTPRVRRTVNLQSADESPLPPIPRVTSSAAGGITTRTVPEGYKAPSTARPGSVLGLEGGVNVTPVEGKMSNSESGGASIALQRSVRALDGVERIGRLLTLDLKGNDIKVSQSAITRNLGTLERYIDRAERRHVHCPSAQTESNAQGAEFERQQD